MSSNIIDEVLTREEWPTFTNDPDDRGGPTKGGITQATLSGWRGRPVTVDEVRDLGEDEARAIYQYRYIDAPGFSSISDLALREQVVDAGVLHGQSRASKWLQTAVGATPDGVVGRLTLRALALHDPHVVALRFAAERIRFVGEVIASNYRARVNGTTTRDQARFASGWLNRLTSFVDAEADAGSRAVDNTPKRETD